MPRFGKAGSDAADWEKATWPFLKELAEKHPEAGLHFRGMRLCQWLITGLDGVIDQKTETLICNRKKDQGSDEFVSELARKDPWYKNVVPDVWSDTIASPRMNHEN